MDDEKKETFEFYYAVIEKWAKKIEMDVELVKQQAAMVFFGVVDWEEKKGGVAVV